MNEMKYQSTEEGYQISKEIIKKYISKFDSEEEKERVLTNLFKRFDKNTSLEDVVIKVTALNALYNAGLNNSEGSKTIDVFSMAKHIVSEPEFDSWLDSENADIQMKAYKYIESGTSVFRDSNYNNCYAFASKYCSWHKPDKFPIMDSCAKKSLYNIIVSEDNDFSFTVDGKTPKIEASDFHDYDIFSKACKSLRDYIVEKYDVGKEFDLKELDKYLWERGRIIDSNATGRNLAKIGGE